MYFHSGYVSWNSFWLMLLFSFLAFVLLYSFRLIMSCLGFIISDSQRLGDNIFMALLTFASQPASIFTGWYKVLFLTIIPAGMISFYPVNLIKSFSWQDFTIFLGGILTFWILSLCFYRWGLKHYSSGNRFGVR